MTLGSDSFGQMSTDLQAYRSLDRHCLDTFISTFYIDARYHSRHHSRRHSRHHSQRHSTSINQSFVFRTPNGPSAHTTLQQPNRISQTLPSTRQTFFPFIPLHFGPRARGDRGGSCHTPHFLDQPIFSIAPSSLSPAHARARSFIPSHRRSFHRVSFGAVSEAILLRGV